MKNKNLNQKGFTLIEMSLALIILGVLFGTAFSLYTPYLEKKKAETTQERLDRLYAALEEFKIDRGFYPCPASLSTARGDVTYGYAEHPTFTGSPNPHCADTASVAPGTCAADGSYCVKQSVRALPDQRVRIGAVPFRELNLSERDSYDGYKSKFYYAVTESMARDTNSFNLNNGAIDVIDSRGVTLLDTAGSVSFLIFSPGMNKIGAYNQNGQMVNPCGAPYTGADIQNCGNSLNASFLSIASNAENATNEMDDMLAFDNAMINRSLHGWRKGNVDNGELANDVISQRSMVVGDFNSMPRQEIDVSGTDNDIRIESVLVAETALCKNDNPTAPLPEECFNVAMLTQTCPAGQYVTGIGPYDGDSDGNTDSFIQCSPVLYNCDLGFMIVGVDNTTGEPICAPIPNGGGGGIAPGGPPPPIGCGSTRTREVACSNSANTYSVYESYHCGTSSWIYNNDSETADCCGLTAGNSVVQVWTTKPYTPIAGEAIVWGPHWSGWVCGHGHGQRKRTRTVNSATCSHNYSGWSYNCVCNPDAPGTSNPIGYNSSKDYITDCKVDMYTFGPGGTKQCGRTPIAPISPGSYITAPGKLEIVGSPDNQDVLSTGTKQEGDGCTVGSPYIRCAASTPVSAGSSNYQYYNQCRCVKNGAGEKRC